MKPFHVLVAALSVGGTFAAVSATHAAAFDPVRLAGSMGEPGTARSIPCEALLVTSPRPCTKPVITVARGSQLPSAVDVLDDDALDRAAARVVDDPAGNVRTGPFQLQVSQDIYRIHGGPARLASSVASAGSAADETVLDISRE
jgi:hypothetical protein